MARCIPTHRISRMSIEVGMKIMLPNVRRVIRVKSFEHGANGTTVVSTEGIIYRDLNADSEIEVVPAEGEIWA